jgi:hypothetical protein
VGAFNVVVVGVEACGHLEDDGVFSLVRLGAQRGGEVEDVVVYGALEFTQGRDEGGFRVVLLCSYVSRASSTLGCPGAEPRLPSRAVQPATEMGFLTGELAGGIMTKRAAQRAWSDESSQRAQCFEIRGKGVSSAKVLRDHVKLW